MSSKHFYTEEEALEYIERCKKVGIYTIPPRYSPGYIESNLKFDESWVVEWF